MPKANNIRRKAQETTQESQSRNIPAGGRVTNARTRALLPSRKGGGEDVPPGTGGGPGSVLSFSINIICPHCGLGQVEAQGQSRGVDPATETEQDLSRGRLPFPMQTQKQILWCWAAVAVSIDDYLSAGGSKWTQCKLASQVFGNTVDCCASPDDCNEAQYLESALSGVARLKKWEPGSLSFEEIQNEIGRPLQLPVCVRIGWAGGGGHFVVIVGYRETKSGQQFVDVADPWYGDSTLRYEDFRDRYQYRGQWTETYYVNS